MNRNLHLLCEFRSILYLFLFTSYYKYRKNGARLHYTLYSFLLTF